MVKKKGIRILLLVFSFFIILIKGYGLIDLLIIQRISIDKLHNKNKTSKNNYNQKITKIKKVKKKIIVGIEKEYIKTFYGKLEKKIINNFLKSDYKIKYKIIKKDKIIEALKTGNIQILLGNFNNITIPVKRKFYSLPLFSKAVYFLMNEENYKKFIYPTSLFTEKIGLLYESDSYKQLNKIFSRKKQDIRKHKNLIYFKDFDNLIEYFNLKKISIILLTRKEYYKKYYSLPGIPLFFIEYGEAFGKILFLNENIKNNFNSYLKKRVGEEHAWEILFLKKRIATIL